MNWNLLTPKEAMDWVIVGAFTVLFFFTLLSMTGWIRIPEDFRKHLFKILICEIVTAGFYIFYVGRPQPCPDFGGEWSYTCSPTNQQWGGTCQFTPKDGGLFVDGSREWEMSDGKKQPLSPPAHWESLWASYAEGHVGYHYKLTKNGVEGFAEGSVILSEDQKKPVLIKGNFWVLPPGTAIYGEMEITKKTK